MHKAQSSSTIEDAVLANRAKKHRVMMIVGVLWLLISVLLAVSNHSWLRESPWILGAIALILMWAAKVRKSHEWVRSAFGICSLLLALLAVAAFYYVAFHAVMR